MRREVILNYTHPAAGLRTVLAAPLVCGAWGSCGPFTLRAGRAAAAGVRRRTLFEPFREPKELLLAAGAAAAFAAWLAGGCGGGLPRTRARLPVALLASPKCGRRAEAVAAMEELVWLRPDLPWAAREARLLREAMSP